MLQRLILACLLAIPVLAGLQDLVNCDPLKKDKSTASALSPRFPHFNEYILLTLVFSLPFFSIILYLTIITCTTLRLQFTADR